MKKKFDFTAEMNATQNPINGPENDFLEEEKRLIGKIGVCCYSGLAERNAEYHVNSIFYRS